MTTTWLIIFVACIVIEIITMGLTTIWFAGGSLVAAVSAAFSAPLWLQLLLFVAISFTCAFVNFPAFVRPGVLLALFTPAAFLM